MSGSQSHSDGSDLLLGCDGLTVRFDGLRALNNLTLSLRTGELLGIAGPNGAGKTTLFNVISGHIRPSGGRVRFRGREITGLPPHKVFQLGVARTFQLAQVVSTQDFYTNVLIGSHFSLDRGRQPKWRVPAEAYWTTADAVERFGLARRATVLAESGSLYERKMVMLAAAMAHTPAVLLLDEPIGGLNRKQATAVLTQIERIRSSGTTVVVIEHVMRELISISDRLVILHRGTVLFDGKPEDAQEDRQVRRAYLGAAPVTR